MAVLIVIAAIVLRPDPIFLAGTYGAVVYLLYSNLSKVVLSRSHREGRRLTTEGHYEQAVAAFDRSYAFFSKYRWIDQYRYLVMLDSAALSYREMALVNAGYCCVMLGDLPRAKTYYQKVLAEFPNNTVAKNNLTQLTEYERQNTSGN